MYVHVTARELYDHCHELLLEQMDGPWGSKGKALRALTASSGLSFSTVEKFYNGERINPQIDTLDALLTGLEKMRKEGKKNGAG